VARFQGAFLHHFHRELKKFKYKHDSPSLFLEETAHAQGSSWPFELMNASGERSLKLTGFAILILVDIMISLERS
jgi:hypothetical protein